MDANVGAAVFKKGASLEATTASLSNPRSSYDTYSYTVSKGAIIDISWKGLFSGGTHASMISDISGSFLVGCLQGVL